MPIDRWWDMGATPTDRATPTEAVPAVEQRIGVRRAVEGVTLLVPGDSGRRRLGTPPPVAAPVVNLSVTGAAIVPPGGRDLLVGSVLPVTFDDVTGKVRVRRVQSDARNGFSFVGVSFNEDALTVAAANRLEILKRSQRLGGSLIDVLDDLAGWIHRTAAWSDDAVNLRRLATDLSTTLARLSKPDTPVVEIIANVCWIDSDAETTRELDDLGRWTESVTRELSPFPHEAKKELAEALITLGKHPATTPLGHQVLPALAESLLA